jgi:hypothetical protein
VVENGKFASLSQFYEGTGVYVKSGLVDPDLVNDFMMEGVIAFWDRFSTIIEGYKSKYNEPQIYLGIEYLYHEMKKVREARGYPASTFVHSIQIVLS